MNWSKQSIKRLILDWVLKVTREPFVGNASRYTLADADFKDDLGLDSIQLMELAAHVNSFFHIFSNPQPPYLLAHTRLNEWVNLVEESLQQSNTTLNFQTSGTTGTPEIIQHSILFLERELDILKSLFPDIKEIITFVPSYTIYGFLFTIGLPQHLSIPVVFASEVDWTQLTPRSLVVGTPFHWRLLNTSLSPEQPRFSGVSAAATLDPDLYAAILKRISLIEIYGSTETGGVGWRKNGKDAFTLFPYWRLEKQSEELVLVDQDDQKSYALMDEVEVTDTGQFIIKERKDKKINVAGILVDLTEVCSKISELPNIISCKLAAKKQEGEIRLEAFIQLRTDGASERKELAQQIKELLPAHERPVLFYV